MGIATNVATFLERIFTIGRMIEEIQHFFIARDLLKGYVKIGRWE
jgi:hypothetical protein